MAAINPKRENFVFTLLISFNVELTDERTMGFRPERSWRRMIGACRGGTGVYL